MKQYAVLNFAYGTGPYLMATRLGIAFNDALEKAGQPRMGIIVPWVYGQKQKEIMAEDFSAHEAKYPGEIMLDAGLGAILEKVFYGNESYEAYLQRWTADFKEVSRQANKYLMEKYGEAVVVELNRSPRLLYGLRIPVYSTSFGHMSQIFEKSAEVPAIPINRDLLKKAAEIAKCIEREQQILAVAYPGVFSHDESYQPVYKKSEVLVPPIAPMPKPDATPLKEDGVFITKTGIPGLERLYGDIEKELGLAVYDNNSYGPDLITNEKILLHFARSGWASIWRSMLARKPLIVPSYDPKDDPEIYFNNLAIEKSGIGVVYSGGSLGEIIAKKDTAERACDDMIKKIKEKWGTADGTAYCAELFAKAYIANTKPL